jgi:hypothetical protein
MALPVISNPEYFIELPSTGKKVKYRPFVVREEKLLLLALESEDLSDMSNAVKNVLSNCVKGDNLDIETLPTFDIEYLFLNIRGKAVGEDIEVNILCPDDEETYVNVKIFIDDIKVVKNPEHQNQVKINDTLMMEMKYPSLEQFIKSNFDLQQNKKNQLDQSLDLIASCVNKIYNEDEVWTSSDVTTQEIIEFLESMNSTQFKKIENFFETMPKLEHKVKIKNPNTKVESEVTLMGLADFFG